MFAMNIPEVIVDYLNLTVNINFLFYMLRYVMKVKYSQVCINIETMVTRSSFVKKEKKKKNIPEAKSK